ncbi:MAG: HDIG domain-containing protein [Verrucomicrobiota bacterium]|nr:HDIG domain-containing protein [Verrucomicrobiota bacterium]
MNEIWDFRHWLSQNRREWRLLVALICIIAITLFLQFRQLRLEILELHQKAERYVIALVDFEFPDEEMTLILKQQAMQEIGQVYQLDEQEVKAVRLALEQKLIRSKEWREVSPSSTFEQMYKAADELETSLLEIRFSDPRTIGQIREMGLSTERYFAWIPEEGRSSTLPGDFWDSISEQMEENALFPAKTVQYVMLPFQEKQWMFKEAISLEQNLRVEMSKRVPEKLTRVYAGTRLLNPGEEITERHMVMMQAMKETLAQGRKFFLPLPILSNVLLASLLVLISAFYFKISQPLFLRSLQQLSLFVTVVILTLLFAKCVEYLLVHTGSSLIAAVRYPVVAPFATLLICLLLSPSLAFFAAAFLSVILSVSLAIDHSRFLILNLLTSTVVIISSRGIRKRKEIFTVCAKTWVSAIPVLYAFVLAENQWINFSFCINVGGTAVLLLFIAIIVAGFLPILESLFGILTDMALMEYTDPGNLLLRRFAMEIPGTYQHSLVLGHLAETCAQAIGANGLFCRAATLYHDIGKLGNPQLYTENQQGSVNLHQLLTPVESAQAIISHVSDGVALAGKYHLPSSFIDIIKEHHGTTLVYYFYSKQAELQGGRKEEVDETKFRYPGPRPKSRESAIIMICDSIEAASRSLDSADEHSVQLLVERVVREKAEDGQFAECNLTFAELTQVMKVLIKTILLTHHVRIKYPAR